MAKAQTCLSTLFHLVSTSTKDGLEDNNVNLRVRVYPVSLLCPGSVPPIANIPPCGSISVWTWKSTSDWNRPGATRVHGEVKMSMEGHILSVSPGPQPPILPNSINLIVIME